MANVPPLSRSASVSEIAMLVRETCVVFRDRVGPRARPRKTNLAGFFITNNGRNPEFGMRELQTIYFLLYATRIFPLATAENGPFKVAPVPRRQIADTCGLKNKNFEAICVLTLCCSNSFLVL